MKQKKKIMKFQFTFVLPFPIQYLNNRLRKTIKNTETKNQLKIIEPTKIPFMKLTPNKSAKKNKTILSTQQQHILQFLNV